VERLGVEDCFVLLWKQMGYSRRQKEIPMKDPFISGGKKKKALGWNRGIDDEILIEENPLSMVARST